MRPFFLLFFLALTANLSAQPSPAGPRLFPRGVYANGIQETRYDKVANAYLFTLKGLTGKKEIEYRLPLAHPYLSRGVLRIEETTSGVIPLASGGLSYRTTGVPTAGKSGRIITPHQLAFSGNHDPAHTGTVLSHKLDPLTGTVIIRISDDYLTGAGTNRCEKTYQLRLYGRSLEIRARGDEKIRLAASYNYAGFHFGPGTDLPIPSAALHIPYMDMIPVFSGKSQVFVSRFLDWYLSNGSDTPNELPATRGSDFSGGTGSGYYQNDAKELNAPISEVAWLTVSDHIEDTFAVIDRPPSPYRLLTASRAVAQNSMKTRYTKVRDWVLRASSLGMDDMIFIKWDWQKWPIQVNKPDFMPAAPAMPVGTNWGTAKEWLDFATQAAQANWNLCLYFTQGELDPGYPNLTLLLPTAPVQSVLLTANPAYNPLRVVRDSVGNAKKGWDTNNNFSGTNLAGKGHAVDIGGSQFRAGLLAKWGSRIFGTNGYPVGGLHIDAQTSIPGWTQIDQRKHSGFRHTIAETLRDREITFSTGKDVMQGPLMGENGHWRYRTFATYAAGLVDGTSRKIPLAWNPSLGSAHLENWDAPVIPDYELTEVIPRGTAFFGMGWHPHFKKSSYPLNDTYIDAWHTSLLSFGHAPFFANNGDVKNNYWDWQRNTRSYYLLHGLAASMRSSRIKEIRYVDGGGLEKTLQEALALNLDLGHPRLALRFANGLEFKANHSGGNWVTTVASRKFTIPTDGFVGIGTAGLIALSAINPASGKRVDYAHNPGHSEMIDQRGVNQLYNNFPAKYLPIPTGLFNPPITTTDLVVVNDLRRNQVIYGHVFAMATQKLGTAPTLIKLAIKTDDTTTLSLGRLRIGLRAEATDSNGHQRDVTSLVKWTSSAPAAATVNRMGGVKAIGGGGQATIRAALTGPNLKATQNVNLTALPILGPLLVKATGKSGGCFSFTTDTNCLLTALVLAKQGGTPLTFFLGRPGPAGKTHQFALTGLLPATGYELSPVALNEFGFIGWGKKMIYNTP